MTEALCYYSLDELDKIRKIYEKNIKKGKGCARNKKNFYEKGGVFGQNEDDK